MITMELRGTKDWRLMARVVNKLEKNTDRAVSNSAQWLVNDIRCHWSPTSPSSVGSPPAVVSGNLDTSVIAEQQGRSLSGQFASKENAVTWYVTVDTTKGSVPRNRGQYGAALEYNMDRPFFAPAIERMKSYFKGQMKKVL